MWRHEKLWKATGYYLKGKRPVHTHNKKYITFHLDVKPHGDCDLDLSLLQWRAEKQIHGVSPTGLPKSWTFPRYCVKEIFQRDSSEFQSFLASYVF